MDEYEDDECHSNANNDWHQKYSNWEQECINHIESLPDLAPQIDGDKEISARKLWCSFQNAACCVAQMYKERNQTDSMWLPFQNAASSVTSLYKDSIESQRRLIELGMQCGGQRRNQEMLAWAKKRKRHIRREDLIAFISGRHSGGHSHHHAHSHHYSHHRAWNSPKQRLTLPESALSFSHSQASGGRTPPHHAIAFTRLTLTDPLDPPNITPNAPNDVGDLETFREALALSEYHRNSPQSSRRTYQSTLSTRLSSSSVEELNAFITEEFNRHVESRKRTSSSSDVNMDSPTQKRSKLV